MSKAKPALEILLDALRELRRAGDEGALLLCHCGFSFSVARRLADLRWITIDTGPIPKACARLSIPGRIELARSDPE